MSACISYHYFTPRFRYSVSATQNTLYRRVAACIEPTLQPTTGEVLSHATAISNGRARLDIAENGFWGGPFERAFFDVRVFNPHAPSNRQPLPACYRKHKTLKKRAYKKRVQEIEHGSFTTLVLSLTGGLGNAASVSYKRLASLISAKRDALYSCTMAWPGLGAVYPFLSSGHPFSASEEPASPQVAPSSNPSLHSTLSPPRPGSLPQANFPVLLFTKFQLQLFSMFLTCSILMCIFHYCYIHCQKKYQVVTH